MMQLGIVIPCYNESKRLSQSSFGGFLNERTEVDFCFVNDGSTDTTLEVLTALRDKFPRQIQLINLESNAGKANAVRSGVHHLLQKNKYDRIAFLDADLSTSLESCWVLAKKINTSTKFVFGSRIKKIDNRIDRRWYRFLVGRVIATFISQMLQLSVYDTQCGCKVFKPEIASLAFKEPFLSRWLFDVEVFYRLKNRCGTERLQEFSKEIPLDSWVDKGDSKISLSYCFWVWIDLLTLYRFYK